MRITWSNGLYNEISLESGSLGIYHLFQRRSFPCRFPKPHHNPITANTERLSMEQSMPQKSLLLRVYGFYADGLRRMTLGRTLWKIILVKLLIMFGVLKLFFFPDFLQSRFATDQQRADYVLGQITGAVPGNSTAMEETDHD